MSNQKPGVTKPTDRRSSIVRQTRSQTKAAAVEAAKGNLEISQVDDDADIGFEPSFIDTTGGDDNDCAACQRPNNAERYMVQCEKCECYYHFSCVGVTIASAKAQVFVCKTCLQPGKSTARSVTCRSNTSSAARIALELQCLDEESKLEDEIAQEKHKLEELNRKKAYMAKKHELLRQQEEIEEKKSERSFRTNRTSLDRVGAWVAGQKETQNTGLRTEDETTSFADPILPTVINSIEQLGTNYNSTPLPDGKSVDEVLGRATAELTPGDASILDVGLARPEENPAAKEGLLNKNIIPLVGIQPIDPLLEDGPPGKSDLGVRPKIIRVPLSNYELWRSRSDRPALTELKEQHKKDLEAQKQREMALIDQLKQLQQQQKDQRCLYDQREQQLKAEIQRKEKEQHDLMEQAKQAATDRNKEMERCREMEDNIAKLKTLRLSGQNKSDKVETLNHKPQNNNLWYNEELEKLRQCRQMNATPATAGAPATVDAPARNALLIPGDNASISDNAPTPCGGRSSTWLPDAVPPEEPIMPPDQISSPLHANRTDLPIGPRSVLTPRQLAARHVVSKELPPFTGDSSEWTLFISSYNHSTEACGYTDSENLLRLQRALKGEARATVSSLLLHPSTVPQVLYSLQLRYGKPEQVVHNLIKKVKETPAPTTFDAITSFGLMVQNLCGHLNAIGMQKHLANPELLKQLVSKLPSHIMYNWAMYQQTLPDVDLIVFGNFMARVAAATSSIWFPDDKQPRNSKGDRARPKEKAFVNAHSTSERTCEDDANSKPKQLAYSANKRPDNNRSCSMCNTSSHQMGECSKFKKLTVNERWQLVKEKKLCRRCLISHSRYTCKGEPCGINGCKGRHHKLLHNDQLVENKTSEATTSPPSGDSTTTNATVTIHRQPSTTTLFRVLPVTLYGKHGPVNTFAFLDDGSSVTLVEKSIAAELGLEGRKDSLCIHWTSGVTKNIADTQRVEMEISGGNSSKRFRVSDVYTVDDLGLPQQTMNYEDLATQFKHLQKLPVQSLNSAVPGILIGLSNVHLLATLKLRQGDENEPIATKTRLGWAISGSSPGGGGTMHHRQLHICDSKGDLDLHELVRGFFAIESLGATTPSTASLDEQRASKILTETTKRTDTGRFETGLLWKHDYIELPDSKPMAEKRFRCLEKRLSRDPQLYENMRKQIAEYVRKGYAHEVTEAELASYDLRRMWYLPIGVVINPKKPGKFRIIWDAAAMVGGVSLNAMLLKGPDLLTPLLVVLFQFREGKIAICADIEAMFHQVLIRPADRCAQLFLWRDTPEQPLKTMVTDVAIFGATCSPTHSQYVKNLNASEHSTEFPRAAAAIHNKHYVDDYLDSLDTAEEAVATALEVAQVHAKAGFHIRNWISNDKTVLQRIGAANPSTVKHFAIDKDSGFERLLGIVWLPEEDVFSFSLNFRDDLQKLISGEEIPTKKQLLSVVMSLYDPQGMISTFVVHGKIIIQDVWRENIGWNERIPTQIFSRWKLWTTALQKLDGIKIPRCYFPNYRPEDLKTLELHVFVDASEKAYAAVAYFRIVNQAGQARCVLVASKTKVAPLQPLSIPRLELLAAVLGVRLRQLIGKSHSLTIKRVHMWSDSCNTLTWIRATDLRRFRPYVGLRVNDIQTQSDPGEWRYVPTRLNVADEATKWGKGPSFDSSSRWYQGPKFLYEREENWPEDRKEFVNEAPDELRAAFVYHHFIKQPTIEFERFSKWERLLRCVAYVHRFVENCRRRRDSKSTLINEFNRDELQRAERSLWLLAQSDAYPDEIALLNQNSKLPVEKQKPLEKANSLRKLCPGLDEFGILRAQNRIDAADCVGYDAKYPILLPKGHRITNLLVDYYHRRLKHKNKETVVNEIRQKFDIPKLRVVVTTVAKQCMWCRVYKAEPAIPRMGPIPRARLGAFVRPFSYTGIDYFGPYLIKIGRTAVKRWVVLFTCLTIRAVHLEVAASLSTDSCKKAIRRFIDRRGHPLELYSDRGTNFVGASRELRDEIESMNKELASTFTDAQTQWRFNPPATPHMGGCWERMVRSIKAALDVVPTDRKLDEESFATLLTDAENMVNSRPLTFISLEGSDQEALTPNHFLLMSSSGVIQPVKAPVDEGAALRSSWNRIQRTLDGFWRRWILEYLPMIARRTKWFKNVKPIKVGQLVVAVDEGVRNCWTRGYVVKTILGKDNAVRQVDIRTSDGDVVRKSVSRIAVLHVEEEGDAHAEQ